jgi:hypothetical protein
MSLKDYKYYSHKCQINNHSEFTRLLKWFLKHGAEDCYGNDIPMFENIYDICDELEVNYDDWDYSGDNDEEAVLIKEVSELEEFLSKNINENTIVPSEDEYPILVDWYKEDSFDRVGNCSIKILNFTSMKDIKQMKDYLIDYTNKLREKNSKHRERCKLEREVRAFK